MRFLFILIFLINSQLLFCQGPALLWAKKMGSAITTCDGNSLKIDNNGSVYIFGYYSGVVDFDPNIGVFNLTSTPGLKSDAFISKLNANGDFVWAKSIGGIGDDVGLSITVDAIGNVYACGIFSATTDFDPGPGTYSLTSNGDSDVFVLKLDSDGNFVWAKSLGGIDYDPANGLVLDATNNIYVCGRFFGTVDFDPNAGIYNVTALNRDAFVLKLDQNGSFIWVKTMGGSITATCFGISIDGIGNIYATGTYAGTIDFDPGASTYNLNSVANSLDAFVVKLDPSGNFIWAKSLGGISGDLSYAIALDASGNAYTTGFFAGDADFDPGSGTFSLSASTIRSHIYVSKLDASGNFVWAKGFVGDGAGGSPKDNYGKSIAVDGSGNVYTTGQFEGNIDFDPGIGTHILSVMDNFDIFISKLDVNGNYVWSGRIGAGTSDGGNSIAVDSFGNLYCTGNFYSTVDFDPDAGIYNLTGGGCFILKMAPCCAGFEEFDANKNFIHVYPNPNRGEFSIDVPREEKNVRLVLYNLMGQIVFTQSLSSGVNSIKSNLSKGLYLARVQGETFTSEAAKVIVE